MSGSGRDWGRDTGEPSWEIAGTGVSRQKEGLGYSEPENGLPPQPNSRVGEFVIRWTLDSMDEPCECATLIYVKSII